MRILPLLAAAALLATAMSGCAGGKEKDDGPSPSSSTSSSTGPLANQTTNQTLVVLANLTATPLNGTAPLNVTFTLAGNATRGNTTGNVTWTLAFGDGNSTNGTSLPHNVTYSYAAGGNFSARLTVISGAMNATSNVTIAVAPGGVGFAPGMDPNCQRPDARGTDSGGWIDDRGGGSVWVYEETNGLPGLQIDIRPSPVPAPVGGHQDSLALQYNCVGGDQMYF